MRSSGSRRELRRRSGAGRGHHRVPAVAQGRNEVEWESAVEASKQAAEAARAAAEAAHLAREAAIGERTAKLPRRILLIRHAESVGNVDESVYEWHPDPEIPLTWRGEEQGRECGRKLEEEVDPDEKVFLYLSPYRRCKETAKRMLEVFDPHRLEGIREEPQIREQDFGNFQDSVGKQQEKEERLRYGKFYYR